MANNKLFNCDHCKHQRKVFHEDKRYKEGGYWLYSCALNGDPFDAHAVHGYPNEYCSNLILDVSKELNNDML